jgi:hypothetical protein
MLTASNRWPFTADFGISLFAFDDASKDRTRYVTDAPLEPVAEHLRPDVAGGAPH